MSDSPQQPARARNGWLEGHHESSDIGTPVVSPAHEIHNNLSRDGSGGGYKAVEDTQAIESAYSRYLQTVIVSPRESRESSLSDDLPEYSWMDQELSSRRTNPDGPFSFNCNGTASSDWLPLQSSNGQEEGLNNWPSPTSTSGHHFPGDALDTLYVEGLPADCTVREVAHIFRPFLGYQSLRLLWPESGHADGYPEVLGFVKFYHPTYAASAFQALQGYKMDEDDPDSACLQLLFC